ncbi:MAG: glutamate--tRNA ligase [Patescibacteria group bacterium]|jgi:nondiscriminating glutamyl-tRNA synthetase
MKPRVRFAPSPTGRLHIGGLRTALFNYLFAKKHGGTFILRIEDTDQQRFVPGAFEDIVDTLQAYGLVPDEGPVRVDGKIAEQGACGPYTQSKRLASYTTAVQQLVAAGKAYPCFCTPERLQELRASQERQHLPPGYDGTCRDILPTTAAERAAAGERHIIRFRMPAAGAILATDLIRGSINFQSALLEDTVLLKSDGFPTYHLANVVDDHAMEITHVFRAEEWLPSLPLHLQLYEAFGWSAPTFGHLSHILGANRKKLSKRDGTTAAGDFLKDYLPFAMVNFISLLGWNPKSEQEFFPTYAELINAFDITQVNKAGAIFDLAKLQHLHRLHLRAADPITVAQAAGLHLTPEQARLAIPLAVEQAVTLSEIPQRLSFLLADQLAFAPTLLVPKKGEPKATQHALQSIHTFWSQLTDSAWESAHSLREQTLAWITTSGQDTSTVLWPARVALTGLAKSPDVFGVAIVLGKAKSLQRLVEASSTLS